MGGVYEKSHLAGVETGPHTLTIEAFLQHYIRLIDELISHGMQEKKAICLVASTYGVDWHVLQVLYQHKEEI